MPVCSIHWENCLSQFQHSKDAHIDLYFKNICWSNGLIVWRCFFCCIILKNIRWSLFVVLSFGACLWKNKIIINITLTQCLWHKYVHKEERGFFRVWMPAVSSAALCLDGVEGSITRFNWDAISTQADGTQSSSWSWPRPSIIKQESQTGMRMHTFWVKHSQICMQTLFRNVSVIL